MKLLDFIKEHDNWKELLKEDPYFLDIKEEDDLTLLKYNQIKSDFSQDIVKECRGIILDKNNNIVCFPLYRVSRNLKGFSFQTALFAYALTLF